MLLYALEPAPDFFHKIGMAKSLGLGTVKITPAAVLFIDRQKRYSLDGFEAQRYEYADQGDLTDMIPGEFMDRHEKAVLDQQSAPGPHMPSIGSLKSEFEKQVLAPIKKALLKAGQPDVKDIWQPLAQSQITPQGVRKTEKETFQWFQNNDRRDGPKQGLVPLEYGDETTIPRLEEN